MQRKENSESSYSLPKRAQSGDVTMEINIVFSFKKTKTRTSYDPSTSLLGIESEEYYNTFYKLKTPFTYVY